MRTQTSLPMVPVMAPMMAFLLAACGGGADSGVCTGPEVLSFHQGEVVVMVPGCAEIPMRPATPEDLARLEPPL